MAKGAFSPDFLNEVIDGRVLAGPAHGEVAALARLARSCGRLADAGPDPAVMDRMLVRFRGHLRDEGSQPAAAWLAGWAGLGARPRPLIQRLAAGSVLLVAAGGGATAAAGEAPLSVATGAVDLARSAILNLNPNKSLRGAPSIAQEPLSGPPGAVATPSSPSSSAPAATPDVLGIAGGPQDSPATAVASAPAPATAAGGGLAGPPVTTTPPAVAGTTSPGATATTASGRSPTPATPAGTPVATDSAAPASPTSLPGTQTPPAATHTPSPTGTGTGTPTGSPTPASTPTPTSTPTAPPTSGHDYAVGEAATVTLSVAGGTLSVDRVAANPGWSLVESLSTSTSAHMKFANGTKTAEFEAELDGGTIKTRVSTAGGDA